MQHYKTVFIFFTLISFLTLGQGYYKGVVVLNSGDSTSGFIEARESDENPSEINFKTSLDADKRTLTSADISYFRIDGIAAFRLYTVSISMYPVDLKLLNELKTPPAITKTVFLKTLQEGKTMSLMSYKDGVKLRFFAIHDQAPIPRELVYRVIRRDLQFVESFAFREELTLVAQRAGVMTDKLKARIGNSMYQETDLLRISSAINQITTVAKKNNVKKFTTGFVIGGGFVNTKLHFFKADPYLYPNADEFVKNAKTTSPSKDYWYGAGFDLAHNSVVGQVMLRADMFYNKASFAISSFDNTASSTLTMDHSFSLETYTAGLYLRYNFYNKRNIKCFASAGMRFSHSKTTWTYQLTRTSTGHTDYFDNPAAEPKDHYASFPMSAGVVIFKRYEIGLTYSLTQPVSVNRFVYIYGFNILQGSVAYHFYK